MPGVLRGRPVRLSCRDRCAEVFGHVLCRRRRGRQNNFRGQRKDRTARRSRKNRLRFHRLVFRGRGGRRTVFCGYVCPKTAHEKHFRLCPLPLAGYFRAGIHDHVLCRRRRGRQNNFRGQRKDNAARRAAKTRLYLRRLVFRRKHLAEPGQRRHLSAHRAHRRRFCVRQIHANARARTAGIHDHILCGRQTCRYVRHRGQRKDNAARRAAKTRLYLRRLVFRRKHLAESCQ